MDSKAFRLSILAIITTVVLIGVVVYAANRDRINSMIGASKTAEAETSEAVEEETVTGYGEQIGDNLKAFLTASDFFDKSEQRPSVVVVVDNVPVPANAEATEEDTGSVPKQEDKKPALPEVSSGNGEMVPDAHGRLPEISDDNSNN